MASTEVDYQPAEGKKKGIAGQIQGFRSYMWNGEKKEFMGRTGSSWGKISIFYLVFYSCLAAFFAAFLAGLLSLMDDKFPNQTGMNSLIKGNPGMGFRPQSDREKTLITFTQGKSNEKTYMKHIKDINKYLDAYTAESIAKDVKESGGLAPVDCADGDERNDPENQACLFKMSDLGDQCTDANDYGYEEGQPCVLLKMNKVYNWVPKLFNSSADLPDNDKVKDNWAPDYLTVTCEGENDPDKDMVGEVEFFPANGFPVAQYFPYYNQPGYRAPLVFAKFKSPKPGTLIQVWCKVWAENIYHDKNDKAGSVHFELLVD